MKRIKSIVGKILLIVMTAFIAHDYMIGQDDAVSNSSITKAHIQQNVSHYPTAVEHQVFHSPALTSSERILMREVRLITPEFRLQTLLSQDFTNPPFTPPKLV
ncbi:hypothetical protein [Hydrogenimonas thermophila]|uniref:Uncharacterized protein n=1 Tax=Hydrogenimonas thermophila TaxID=223786 RepID=A0A1I5ND31_9BACT|nr:hypothetical protein [Hydrogenimonas thermophila]SFP19121.1 hypothetical protein SAMN05216234_10959 [Hydrogenimonas thermophila]